MKHILITVLLCAFIFPAQGQKYFTRDGKITFLSNAPLEEIKATNERATSVFDTETGAVE